MKLFTKVGWILIIALVVFISVFLQSCDDKCEITAEVAIYEPQVLTWSELRTSIAAEEPQEILNTGKIWLYNDYLLVGQPGDGIHIINNTNPSSPVITAFLPIPGNTDMAVKDGFLYVDSYTDLVIIDITNTNAASEVGRLENVYQAPEAWTAHATQSEGIITGYRYVETTQNYVTDCKGTSSFIGVRYMGNVTMMDASFSSRGFSAPQSAPAPNVSIGGSMAASGIVGDFLYVLQQNDLFTFSLQNPSLPSQQGRTNIGWGIETLFPYKDKLFFGAQNGMHIYGINANGQASFISTFQHATACDPVVVTDSLAFVTLRSGNACQGFVNQMDVIDIRQITRPQLIKSYPFHNPHGLGLDQSLLFLCDGNAGLKVFDFSDIHRINDHQKSQDPNMVAFDVIPWNNRAVVIAEDGLYQYSYTQDGIIQKLSRLEIVRSEP
jgi:hypothetical protein